MRNTQLALSLAFLATVSAQAQALTTGDIAFTSFNADEDGWSLVTFVDIAADTTIYFSDNEWNGSSFNTGEGYHTWNTGSDLISAGTVVRFSAVDQSSRSVSFGTLVSTGDTGLNASNETIYAYLGDSTTQPTTFLAGISSEGTTNLAPAGLVSGVSAVVVSNSTDFAAYTGDRSHASSMADYAALVNDPANWNIIVGGDNAAMVPDVTAFAAAVPEPETYAMMLAGLGLLGLASSRRGKA